MTQFFPAIGDEPLAWIECVVEEDRDVTWNSWSLCLSEKRQVTFQFRLTTPQRVVRPDAGTGNITVLCNIFPDIDENGDVHSIMSCITDVSELKDLEERLRARTREVESQMDHALTLRKQQENFIDVSYLLSAL